MPYIMQDLGQGIVEYAFIFVLVIIVLIVMLVMFGVHVGDLYSNIISSI